MCSKSILLTKNTIKMCSKFVLCVENSRKSLNFAVYGFDSYVLDFVYGQIIDKRRLCHLP